MVLSVTCSSPLAHADHAIAFFEEVLRLNGGEFEGIPFALRPGLAVLRRRQPVRLDALGRTPRRLAAARFAWRTSETGKGSGKSPWRPVSACSA